MSKTGIDLFTTLAANVRSISTQTANYSVLTTDEYVKGNATCTFTLPVISTFVGTTASIKMLFFENVSTAANNYLLTISAGSNNTIESRSSIDLQPGEKLILSCTETDTDWEIVYPSPLTPGIRNVVCLVATTNGTTAVNVIDASGCPVVGTIVDFVVEGQDTNAGNILLKNANGTVSTVAKGTSAGLVTGSTTLSTPTMAVGDLLTVESSTTNGNARCRVYLSCQTMTVNG